MPGLLEQILRRMIGRRQAPADAASPFRSDGRSLPPPQITFQGDNVLSGFGVAYQQLVEHAPVGVVLHQSGVIRYANPYCVRLSGAPAASALIGRNMAEFAAPGEEERIRRNLRRLSDGEVVVSEELQVRGIAGQSSTVEAVSLPIIVNGEVWAQTIFRDITDVRRMFNSLRELVGGIGDEEPESVFAHLVRGLALALNVEMVCIAQINPADAAQTLRLRARQLAEGIDSDLAAAAAGAIFQSIFEQDVRIFTDEAVARLGDARGAAELKQLGLRSCVALALYDRRRRPLGALGIASRRPLRDPESALAVIRLFGDRAAAELASESSESRLLAAEQDFQQLIENAADGIVVADANGRIQFANARLGEIANQPPENVRDRHFREFLSDEQVKLLAFDHKRLSRTQNVFFERGLRRGDGSITPIEVSATRLSDGRIMAIIRDIGERARLDEERQSYLETLALLEEAVIELDEQGCVVRVSESWQRLFKEGLESSPLGRPLEERIHPDYHYYLSQNLSRALSGERQQITVQAPAPLPNGSNMWLEGKFVPLRRKGRIVGLRGVLRDVTLDHLNDRQITFYAYYDNLTGLPNRIRMEENLARSLGRAEQNGRRLAIGFIDLDKLDEINNSYGHKIGDKVLLHICDAIRDALGAGENLYRWGGDKLVAIIAEFSDIEAIRTIGGLLIDACRKPLEIEGEQIHATYSVGFAVYPDDGLTAEILLGQADRALSHAKSQGGFNFQMAREAPQRGLLREQLAIRNTLAGAIARREITAYFQPMVRARTHQIVGFETLARWLDGAGKMRVTPAMFIPVAENMGLIADLGEQILERGLAMVQSLASDDVALNMSVNVSRRQLSDPFYLDRVKRAARRFHVDPSAITLEVTESVALLEGDFAIEKLRALHREGFTLSIDDFGTGYSTLSQLHEMPVNELKIDMSFVRRIDTYEGMQVVQAITNMGRALNLDVVAEGVETAETARRLEELGVSVLQGNFFSKALPADEFRAFVRAQRN